MKREIKIKGALQYYKFRKDNNLSVTYEHIEDYLITLGGLKRPRPEGYHKRLPFYLETIDCIEAIYREYDERLIKKARDFI